MLKVLWKGRRKRKIGISGKWTWKIGMSGFYILSFSLSFLVAKFSKTFWPGPLFHVKLSLFEIMRVVNNFCQLMIWICYSLVCFCLQFVSSSILRFWGVGVRSWRNFLLLLIAVREFEDSDFLLRVQMVLFHYAWRLNNVFWEWMSFVATLSQARWLILYLWRKAIWLKNNSYLNLRHYS